MSAIREYWTKNVKIQHGFQTAPRLSCVDGFTMSVQAGYTHYCSPRLNLDDGGYSSWEVGFPSAEEGALMPYAEDEERPTETVYGYVPTEIVDNVIRAHGGLVRQAE